MSFNVRVSGYQDTLRAIRKEMNAYSGGKTYCTVGVHATAKPYVKGGEFTTVAEVAVKNNFGTNKIPARPFLREGVLESKDLIDKTVSSRMSKGAKPREVISVIGALAVRGVQEKIDKTLTPPNSPYTIKKKGSSHPLIDTGHLRQSITYQLRNRVGDKE